VRAAPSAPCSDARFAGGFAGANPLASPLVIVSASLYCPASMRLVLALWAAGVYAWYWVGYLRGQP
jgi:hypothetical protein